MNLPRIWGYNIKAFSAEGCRLVSYHSTRKHAVDAAARAGQIERALRELSRLRQKLARPRTRYRRAEEVEKDAATRLKNLMTGLCLAISPFLPRRARPQRILRRS